MDCFTGIREIDKHILLNLDDKSLVKAALVSKYVNSLMDESFWASRFEQRYGVALWKYAISHRDIYKEFSILLGEKLITAFIDKDFIELVEFWVDYYNKEYFLIYAAKEDHLEVVKLLLNRGADIHADNDDALQGAALNGHLKVVELLLDKGADIHSRNDGALYLATLNGHLKVVELLIDKGANVRAGGDEPLRLAIYYNNLNLVELLRNRGASINSIERRERYNQCQGITKTGNRCNKTINFSSYCSIHKK